ncbi:unnamed protein product [Rangifer tarandus platyrhynchus]|uniref:Uncharacterized protein n=1 Tax=Rangifer tarandus platyrhynchus TaxID=3082113 RepID=A0ABN8YUW7_RANTA|nr:unnamed protein product [Rangifer tarandus platyrhynchus]
MEAFGHPPPYPACHFLAAERSAKRFPVVFAQMWRSEGVAEQNGSSSRGGRSLFWDGSGKEEEPEGEARHREADLFPL